jgi:hypothetical protein
MTPRVFVSTERGSMLPLFIGISALSLLLALGASEVCGSFTYREAMQQTADQVSLVAVARQLRTSSEVEASLYSLTARYRLDSSRFSDGHTAEIRLCGTWTGWLKLPGISSSQEICVNSAAR